MSNELATRAPTSPQPVKFEARLTLGAVVAISVSAMLGSGIFVLPGLAAAMTGPSVWLAYVAAGFCVLPAAFAKSELATAMPTSGGTYVYVERTFGPLVGTILGFGLWLSLLLKSAFALVGFGAYLAVLASVPLRETAIVLLSAIAVLNVLGVKKVGRAQGIVVAVATVVLLAMSAWGMFRIDAAAEPTPFLAEGIPGFAAAMAFVFVSFAGVTKVAAIAEEVENPDRNLPLGILLSLAGVTVLYGIVVFVLTAVVPAEQLQGSLRPVHLLGERLGGSVMGFLAALLGVVTMTSMANAGLLASSRFPFAIARDGLLPPFFRRLHPRYLTPTTCIITTAFVMGIVILTLDVAKIAKLASVFILINYMFVSLSVLVLRETNVSWYKPSYKAPLYPIIPILGVLVTLYLLWVMGVLAIVAPIAIAIPGALIYWLYGRKRTERKGVIGKLGPRDDLDFGRPARIERASGASATKATALVTLLGSERSPETLVEMGAALADHEQIRVELIVELPDQTLGDAIAAESPKTRSLRRRLEATAHALDFHLDFETLSTRDVVESLYRKTQQLESEWLVMAWRARSRGSFVSTLPLGWLTQRLSCNFAIYSDAGVRYIRKILAFVEPGPHDALVASTADHLAEINGGQVTLARFVHEDTQLPLVQAQTDYLEQLGKLIAVESRQLLLRGTSEAATLLEVSEGYDLIILGAPPEKRFMSLLRPSIQDLLHEKGACSVLSLRTPRTRSHDQTIFGSRRRSREAAAEVQTFSLRDHIDERFVVVNMEPAKKEVLFERFAAAFAGALPNIDTPDVVAALWEREKTQNTSVGDGVAMPHATLPTADRLCLGIFTLESGMDYQAIDDKPVDVFFITLGPPSDRTTHLKVLGALSGLVLHSDLLARLRAVDDAAEVEAVIAAASKNVAAHDRDSYS